MERLQVLLHQVESNSSNIILSNCNGNDNINGGVLVARALKSAGIKFIFVLAGGHISPILVGCKNEGIRVIDVRDEVSAVFAADAMGRLSGIPGVAVVTAGPGLTNTITAVKNAQMAESPLLVIGGATAMILKGRGSLQDIDQEALMGPHCKRVELVKSVKDIYPSLSRAISTSLSDVPGPVFLEFPLEVLYPRFMMEAQIVGTNPPPPFSLTPSGIKAKLADRYLRGHINSVYGEDDTNKSYSLNKRVFRIPPVPSLINAGIKALRNSKKPLILIGSQAVKFGEIDQVIKTLESIGAPVYLSGMARGLLGVSHPLLMRHKRRISISKADCVLIIGVALDFRLNYGKQLGKNTFLGMVNLNAESLQKNSDIRARQLSVLADPSLYLIKLGQALESKPIKYSNEWLNECRGRDNEREDEIKKMTQASMNSETDAVHPLYLCSEINKVLDDDSIIVADGGDFIGTASYTVLPRKPLSWLDPGAFGTLGVGGGMAVAAKLARPNSEVWLLYGDGSSAYSLAEIDTCVRHNLPIIAVIGNDAAWMQILRDQVPMLGDSVACTLKPGTRYDVVAQGYGGEGILITKPEEVKGALLKAKEYAAQGKPVVVNCLLSKSKFREGSISI